MITLNQAAAANDNEVIWIVKILGDTQTFRFATTGITLSSNLYDGNVMWGGREGVTEIRESIGVGTGGGIGQVSAFNILISRYNDYTGAEDFFNSFFPAAAGVRLVSCEVNVGFVWSGATTESQITWLKRFYIESYHYTPIQITLYCVEFRELELAEIPYYRVQKDTDNGMSYFPLAPTEALGQTIPIVYGDFTGNTSAAETRVGINYKRVPTVIVNERTQTFLAASHLFHTSVYDNVVAGQWALYKYLGGFDTYMLIYKNADSSGGNSITGYYVNMSGSISNPVLGYLIVRLKPTGSINEVADITNATDDDRATYSELPGHASGSSILSLKTSGSESDSNIGILGRAAADIILTFEASSDTGAARGATVNYWDPIEEVAGVGDTVSVTGTSLADYSWSFGNTKKRDINGITNVSVPYTMQELCGEDYAFTNTETTVGNKIRVYNAFLQISNINVLQQKWVQKKVSVNIQGFGGK